LGWHKGLPSGVESIMVGNSTANATDSFLRGILRPSEGFLAVMETMARDRHIPIVHPETAAFLRFLVASAQPARILEIGTAIGYSAAVMAGCQSPEGRIDTMELDDGMAREAESNFEKLGLASRIRVIVGDARDILPCLSAPYDMIFVDAAKGQYPEYLEACTGLVGPGGILVADNVLFMGLPASGGVIARKHRTIAARLRQYLSDLCLNKEFETAVLPLGDGVAVSCRKSANDRTIIPMGGT
jgi:predicted O-methyltransferase YrrM